jgi:hypothetical protein
MDRARGARLRWSTGALVALALGMMACGGATNAGTTSRSPSAAVPSTTPATIATSPPLTVSSTLDGRTTLPHRIHWQAMPSGADVAEVDFVVDGQQLWVEHNPPYDYGDDGNYLVTSFLSPGSHEFVVRAVALDGRTATDSVTATVGPATPPPAALAGTWGQFQKANPTTDPPLPAGIWRLVISKVGWGIYDTNASRNLLNVAYLSGGLLEVRTGMATGHPGFDLNGWCNNEPGSPVRYRWSVQGDALALAFASGTACPGFTEFITGHWRRGG